jgi:putative (di)nucleoside polyphosphate hydrolase
MLSASRRAAIQAQGLDSREERGYGWRLRASPHHVLNETEMARPESFPYRPCVGTAVFDRDGRVFIGRRIDGPEHVDELAEELCYDIPREILGKAWGGKYRGQCQKWYALRFTGDDGEIDIAHPAGGHKPEFVEWRWERLAKIVELVVPFKRQVYARLVRDFERFARKRD